MSEQKSDRWGRGRFYEQKISNPTALSEIKRHYRRFGLPRDVFKKFLQDKPAFDFVFIQTVMTYWYPGIAEVIEDIRQYCPEAKIVLGGNYPSLCPDHARTLGADFQVEGTDLKPLWEYLRIRADLSQPGLWEAYGKLDVGALKLTDGCPFKCTYCSVPKVYDKFKARSTERSLEELQLICKLGARDVAFYDDALLFDAENVLMPFLDQLLRRDIKVNLHSPNALNARFITAELAELMVRAGFKTFYLGFESASQKWQQRTGAKVYSGELSKAVEYLTAAGAECTNITAYQILGHPFGDTQELEESMRFVHGLGIRGMLADFSPIPGTPDGDYCQRFVDMAEPLMHNKTAFPVILLGGDEVGRFKELQRKLNRSMT